MADNSTLRIAYWFIGLDGGSVRDWTNSAPKWLNSTLKWLSSRHK